MRTEGDLLAPAAIEPEGDDWWYQVWRAGAVSVLVVSESPTWAAQMSEMLEAEGYAVRADDNGDAVRELHCPYDVVVVDMGMSVQSPAAVCATLRSRSAIPILAIASELDREAAVVAAYAAGVDQFVMTGVRQRELVARIRALLRRSPPQARATLQVGSIGIDLARMEATVGTATIPLTVAESEVLHALLQRAGRVVTRRQLNRAPGFTRPDRTLDGLVRQVRNKIEAVEGRRRIVAVRGLGFRFVPDDEVIELR